MSNFQGKLSAKRNFLKYFRSSHDNSIKIEELKMDNKQFRYHCNLLFQFSRGFLNPLKKCRLRAKIDLQQMLKHPNWHSLSIIFLDIIPKLLQSLRIISSIWYLIAFIPRKWAVRDEKQNLIIMICRNSIFNEEFLTFSMASVQWW